MLVEIDPFHEYEKSRIRPDLRLLPAQQVMGKSSIPGPEWERHSSILVPFEDMEIV